MQTPKMQTPKYKNQHNIKINIMHKFVYKNCIGMVIFVMQAHANPERLEEIYKNCNIRFSFLPFSACQTLKIFMLCIS
jgi:hypothetical protein